MTEEVKIKENTLRYVDALKGIAIILVLIGHRSFHPYATYFIYLFHMPLFFFLSGFLDKMQYTSFREMAKKKAARLLYPYVVFGVLIMLYNTFFDAVRGSATGGKLVKRIIAFFYGNCIWENNSDYIGTLWFLLALFLASLLSYGIYCLRYKKGKIPMAIMSLLLLIAGVAVSYVKQNYEIRLPWCLDVAFVAALFYSAGIFWRKWKHREQHESFKNGLVLLVLGTVVGVLNMYYMKISNYEDIRVDMLNMNYGMLPVFVVSALAMSIGVLLIIKNIYSKFQNRFIERWGKLSLLIMIDHIYIFQIFNLVLNRLGINYWLLFFPICLVLSVVLAEVIDRFLPYLFDSKRLKFWHKRKTND